MAQTKVKFELNAGTLKTLILSESLGCDPRLLLYLYDKYGEDILYLFYMCAGSLWRFPAETTIRNIIKTANTIYQDIECGNKPMATTLYKKVEKHIKLDKHSIEFDV